jgi:hypothetical protein
MIGQCQYRYNPSETYQRTKPGMAPESMCGARTFAAVDEPEIMPYPRGDGTTEFRATGRFIARGFDDPYCPAHGGSPEPPQMPVTMPELETAYTAYIELAKRFTGAAPVTTPTPYEIATGSQETPAPIGAITSGQ